MSEAPLPTTDPKVRSAILQAADWIEKHPELYDFGFSHVPDCGSKGCMLGWIGHFAGIPVNREVLRVSSELLGLENEGGLHCTDPFYERIAQLAGCEGYEDLYEQTPKGAAKSLRLYAETYYREMSHDR